MQRRLPTSGLFGGASLPEEAKSRADEAIRSVEAASADYILGQDLELLITEFLTEFGEVTIHWEQTTMSEPQPIQTSSHRDAFGRSVGVPQVRSTATVPLEGHALLLTYYSHHGAPMMAIDGTVHHDSVQLTWTGDPTSSPESIRRWFVQKQTDIQRFLENNNRDVSALNEAMRVRVRAAIERRRSSELARRNLTSTLPFPVTRKATATTPVKAERRRVRVAPKRATPFEPEPELEAKTFEEVLTDVVNMSTILERLPTGDQSEEQIRNLLLAQLNVNYTGEAGGELFNGSGKTDIIVKQGDRHVFIAECKFYTGPKSVTKAVDQLLGYTVWRDSKAALLLFVRDGEFTDVVAKAVGAVSTHAQCQRAMSARDPARRSDYTYVRADDPERAIHLALLPFKLLS